MRRARFLVLLCLLPGAVLAQGDAASTAAVQARVDAELGCIATRQRELTVAARLLEESRVQLRRGAAGSPEQRDAAAAVVSLEQRVHRIGTQLLACLPASAAHGNQAVVYEDPPEDDAADAVATVNPATEVIDQDRVLRGSARVVRGERVDGFGRADPGAVRAALDRVGGELDGCYERLVERGALTSGQAVVSFSVTGGGSTRDHEVENLTFGDDAFGRCLTAAARRIRVAGAAAGGDAVYSYTLRFGAR